MYLVLSAFTSSPKSLLMVSVTMCDKELWRAQGANEVGVTVVLLKCHRFLRRRKEIHDAFTGGRCLTFRHRASCFIGQAFRYPPENAFYVFNQQIYFII